MSLRQRVKEAYLRKQGQTRQSQPQQPQSDLTFYLIAQQQRPRRRIIQPQRKTTDVLDDALSFLNGEK